jgi:hypothetical protein
MHHHLTVVSVSLQLIILESCLHHPKIVDKTPLFERMKPLLCVNYRQMARPTFIGCPLVSRAEKARTHQIGRDSESGLVDFPSFFPSSQTRDEQ